MYYRHFIQLTTALIAILTFSVHAQASNQALLDTLVRKGYLTEVEATALQEESRGEVHTRHTEVKAYPITLTGSIHTQMDMLHTHPSSGPTLTDEKNLFVRRASFKITAPISEYWGAILSPEFTGSVGSGRAAANALVLSSAFLYWDYAEELAFRFGFDGVPFGYEESISSSIMKTVERSVATSYINGQLGCGGGRAGIYATGDLSEYVPGLYYHAGITSASSTISKGSAESGLSNTSTSNLPAYWGRFGYKRTIDKTLKYNFGIQGGYIPRQRVTLSGCTSRDKLMGAYGEITYEQFHLLTELMAVRLNSAKDANHAATPYGFLIQPSYRLNSNYEIVTAYSMVRSKGATGSIPSKDPGINPNKCMRRAPAPTYSVANSPVHYRYQKMDNFYLGGGYYIKGNDIKLTAGYEYGIAKKPSLAAAPKKLKLQGVRARLQLRF